MSIQLVKFRHGNHKGTFHWTLFEGSFVALSEKETSKIDYIKEHGTIDLTFNDSEVYDLMAVDIVTDIEYIEKVYNHFQRQGNSWFNNGFETLCVLKFHK